ncbi:DUF4422 domain-containing protein [Lactobacillus johnsonii]|uniref:DUF4422 domain-containing protein n=1 Tax=Lactobacillus johnsonii TaxID=33959 RepID=UPI0028E4CA0E|nr:DUF4422 domain-containing protein [Lactobacillus johnsonii]MDT9605893.1 DUF4422 domain-containing protein [Lactobacillus johnsonii]
MSNLIFVVTHKKYKIPDFIPYKSISVGPQKDIIGAYYRDDAGSENIASKNSMFCELTAQYWIWKNVSSQFDNIGLNHYRRYFKNSKFSGNRLLNDKQINYYLSKYDIILPDPWYWDITVAENYVVGCGRSKDLEVIRNIIKENYPSYIKSFDNVLNRHNASYCNMFVMRQKYFNEYSEWLFNILDYAENKIDLTDYTPEEARVFGYLAELLINVWVDNKGLKVKYLPMIKKEISFKQRIKDKIKFEIRKSKYKEK